ncbi:hypothetical protein FNV43_RR02079 [Rhamnella rubrinervis]|uniref:Uncharacterized protein n=1 Tax=Rhamnella rubrinervis TaxID=2594499 RepID=A0A8K0HRP1_9ROSA|nr:hypothetical protein FNV43_RR02079 [Rhamnella rubrinervis]
MEARPSKVLDLQEALSSLTLEPQNIDAASWMEKILVGKLLSAQKFRRYTIVDIIKNSWQLQGGVKGVVSRLYGPWLWEGTTNGITFSNLEISDSQQRQVVDKAEAFNADKSNLQRHAYLKSKPYITVQEAFKGGDLDFQSLVLTKAKKNHLDYSQLRLWDRQSIELIAAAEMNKRKSISNLNLHGLEDEITVWLQLAPGKINPAEGSCREGVTGLKEKGPVCESRDNDPKSPESDERHEIELIKDGLIIDLTDYNPLAKVKKAGTQGDNTSPRLEDVAIQLQSTHLSLSDFNPRRATPRYFTWSSQRRQRWRALEAKRESNPGQTLSLEVSRVEQSRYRNEASCSKLMAERDFPKAQEDGLNKPPSSITILAWNCRGLRRKETISALRGLVKKWKPSCLYLAETKCKSSGLLKLCKSLRFDHLEVVESIGRSGGLVLMWIKGIDIEIVLQDANVISFSLSGSNGLPNWKG